MELFKFKFKKTDSPGLIRYPGEIDSKGYHTPHVLEDFLLTDQCVKIFLLLIKNLLNFRLQN